MEVAGFTRSACGGRTLHFSIPEVPPCPLFLSQSPGTWINFQNTLASPEMQHLRKGFESRQARSPPILMHRMRPSNNAIKCSGSKLLIKPQGPGDSRIQQDEAWELTWLWGTSPADLMCSWRGAMKSSQPSLWLILPWQRGSHLVLPKNHSKNRKKLPCPEENSIPHKIAWAKCSLDKLVLKEGWSWSSSDLNCFPKLEQCKYPYCKLALGSRRHWQCSILVIFVMRRRGIMWIYLIWWMLVL